MVRSRQSRHKSHKAKRKSTRNRYRSSPHKYRNSPHKRRTYRSSSNHNVLSSASKLWKYLNKHNAVFLPDAFKKFQIHNEELNSSVPELSLQGDLINMSPEKRDHLRDMLKNGCIDNSETFRKWLDFVIRAETGRRQHDSFDFFDYMLRNVDVLLNNDWYNTVSAARASTLENFVSSDTPEEIEEDKQTEISWKITDRLLKLLTFDEYEKAVRFLEKVHVHGVNSIITSPPGLYVDSLNLNELYPLLKQTYDEIVQREAKASWEEHMPQSRGEGGSGGEGG